MTVNFTGRHVEVSEPLQVFAKERLAKMEHFLDDVIDVHVTLSVEKHRHAAEITLKTRKADFVACDETEDMYKSLTQAFDKLEAQAHKHAGKLQASLKGAPREAALATETE
jgi:putative sigma-54 modulation protein